MKFKYPLPLVKLVINLINLCIPIPRKTLSFGYLNIDISVYICSFSNHINNVLSPTKA